MSFQACEDALSLFYTRDMCAFVDALKLWRMSYVNHSHTRRLRNFAPVVACDIEQLEKILSEYREARDTLGGVRHSYLGLTDTNVERRKWLSVYDNIKDYRAVANLHAMYWCLVSVGTRPPYYRDNLLVTSGFFAFFFDLRDSHLLMTKKTWTNQLALRAFQNLLSKFAEQFLKLISAVSGRLRAHVRRLCNESFPELFEMGADLEARNIRATLRERCALASAVYRRARHLNGTLRSLPRNCYWEILCANTSIFSFYEIATDNSYTTMKGLLEFWKVHQLPTSGLQVCYLELAMLWLMAVSILNEPTGYSTLIRIMLTGEVQARSCGEVWPDENEDDRTALTNYVVGCCYAALGIQDTAIEYLLKVTRYKLNLKTDKFLVPFAMMEAGMCQRSLNQNGVGNDLIDVACDQYGKSSLEFKRLTRVYKRVHRMPPGNFYFEDGESDDEQEFPDLGMDWSDSDDDESQEDVAVARPSVEASTSSAAGAASVTGGVGRPAGSEYLLDSDDIAGPGSRLNSENIAGPGSKLNSDDIAGPGSRLNLEGIAGPGSKLNSDDIAGPGSRLNSEDIAGPGSKLNSDDIAGPGSRLNSEDIAGPGSRLNSDDMAGPGSNMNSDDIAGPGSRLNSEDIAGPGSMLNSDDMADPESQLNSDDISGPVSRQNSEESLSLAFENVTISQHPDTQSVNNSDYKSASSSASADAAVQVIKIDNN